MSTVTVWKKALKCLNVKEWEWEYVIIEMECESDNLLRFVGKCRVPEVKVIGIHSWTGFNIQNSHDPEWNHKRSWKYNYGNINFTNLQDGDIVSWYDHTRWNIGSTVKCKEWDSDTTSQCGGGIHVFLTREEAEDYQF